MSQLRVLHVLMQPVLVWDDGEEFTPGPGIDPVAVPVSQIAAFVEKLPDEVAAVAEKMRRPAE